MMNSISNPAFDANHNSAKLRSPSNVRLRGIALPNEHGSWGILFEPMVAAIAVAYSPAAIWVALLFIGAFLLRQPLRIWLADHKAGRDLPQTAAARKYAFIYFAIFATGLSGTLAFGTLSALVPLLIVAPLGAVQIYYDVNGKSRALLPELTGVVALSSSAAVVALAGGWTIPGAAALWGIFVLRLIPSILYIRNRLRLEKKKPFSLTVPLVTHAIAVLAVASLVFSGLCPRLTLALFVVLLGRAAIGLSPFRKSRKAMQIGIFEVIFGVLTVLSVIVGYHLNL